mmetsp:Transcript_15434/g.23383  ORF Transcript_15434/g.23383 Transcript_15434/m.23383 type:complete len:84 (-) Transcript_15434:124-375(-)
MEVRIVLGTKDSWVADGVLRRVGRIFTAGSKQEEGGGRIIIRRFGRPWEGAGDRPFSAAAMGYYNLPTTNQVEAVAQRAALVE